jgi:plastocyanin
MKFLFSLLAVGLIVLVVALVKRPSAPIIPSPSLVPVVAQPSASAPALAADEASVKVFDVSGANFRFDPDTITVKKGDRVRIVFKSLDMQHDFDLDEFDVDSPVTVAGETSEIDFVAVKTGEFEYYCSVGTHRANGMVGKLIVTE